MSETRKRYRVGAAGGYFGGRLYGEGQIVECLASERSKTWVELDKDDKPIEEIDNATGKVKEPSKAPVPEAPKPAAPHPPEEDADPKTMFGAQRSVKRRSEE